MGGTDFWSRRKAGVETEKKIALQIKDAEETAALQAEQAKKPTKNYCWNWTCRTPTT